MSYHNDPYRVDYLKIYPCLKERPDVLEVLKKSDRKMKYMEVDLKSEQRRKNAANGAESYVPSKEDSLERLVYTSTLASEIIKAKLKAHGGHITVYTARGLPCEIYAESDGTTFTSDKLPVKPAYDYKVFDDIVELLIKQGGRAKKGNGRNYKLGEPGCEENTVVGTIALHRGRTIGESVFDPVFVMAAILEWAGIAKNGRGELILTEEHNDL